MRSCWLLLGVVGSFGSVGCVSWRHPDPITPSIEAPAEPAPPPNATQTVPTSLPETESHDLVTENTHTRNKVEGDGVERATDPLTLVAESLERGDKIAAANHLETYVRRHPEQCMFRLQLAELLLQINDDARAKVHFEQFVARAQTGPESVRKYLVHAHTRLMEIAQRENDPLAELFHRGVGLLILVQEQDRSPDREEDLYEEMLCQSLRALNEAKERKPGDLRVRVYLAEVYERMGNHRAAANERTAACNGIVPGELAPGEQALVLIRSR
jgi:hypothetical protein